MRGLNPDEAIQTRFQIVPTTVSARPLPEMMHGRAEIEDGVEKYR